MTQVSLENNDYLNVEVIGSLDLPKIIFSNSLGSDLRMWDPQVEAMKDKYCIIRYDKEVTEKVVLLKVPTLLICLRMMLSK